jgi:hypothetical protein
VEAYSGGSLLKMDEDLAKKWMNFSLSKEEGVELVIQPRDLEETVSRGHSCAVGKLIADRLVSKETINYALIRI